MKFKFLAVKDPQSFDDKIKRLKFNGGNNIFKSSSCKIYFSVSFYFNS